MTRRRLRRASCKSLLTAVFMVSDLRFGIDDWLLSCLIFIVVLLIGAGVVLDWQPTCEFSCCVRVSTRKDKERRGDGPQVHRPAPKARV